MAEVTAEGFVPGEDVAVAAIVSHTDATGTGEARALIDLDDSLSHSSVGFTYFAVACNFRATVPEDVENPLYGQWLSSSIWVRLTTRTVTALDTI